MSWPCPLVRAAVSQTCGRPSKQRRQRPQAEPNWKTIWSSGLMSWTPGPASTQMPEPSWPSTIGTGRGRSPFSSERSEWQRPAPPILTSTSPGPGGSSSTSMISTGLL